jgi:hypothetical protein
MIFWDRTGIGTPGIAMNGPQAAYLMAFLEDAWAECALRELVEECFGRNEAGRTSAY